MKLRIRFAAFSDLEDARAWYESQRTGLGDEFSRAVELVLTEVSEHPLRHRVLLRDTRQALVRRFPYRLLYRIVGDDVVVVACFHGRRDPKRWERRR